MTNKFKFKHKCNISGWQNIPYVYKLDPALIHDIVGEPQKVMEDPSKKLELLNIRCLNINLETFMSLQSQLF